MSVVGAFEAKTHLPNLLDRVAKGERITITKHGVPVAMLVPVSSKDKPDIPSVIEEIKAFRRGRTLGDMSLREMIEEGRRF
jgi:prevent-host-death family protein